MMVDEQGKLLFPEWSDCFVLFFFFPFLLSNSSLSPLSPPSSFPLSSS
jgi:hypothetical protein